MELVEIDRWQAAVNVVISQLAENWLAAEEGLCSME